MKGAQVGGTEAGNKRMGYVIHMARIAQWVLRSM